MKKIIFILMLFAIANGALIAGNGNNDGSCNCADKTNIYAAGVPEWVSSTQIKCVGNAGTCWEITYNGGWVLTIYTDPPIVFGSNRTQDNPPPAPNVVEEKTEYIIYEIDFNIWDKI